MTETTQVQMFGPNSEEERAIAKTFLAATLAEGNCVAMADGGNQWIAVYVNGQDFETVTDIAYEAVAQALGIAAGFDLYQAQCWLAQQAIEECLDMDNLPDFRLIPENGKLSIVWGEIPVMV